MALPLLPLLWTIGGAFVLKWVAVRFASSGFSLERTITKLRDDVGVVARKLEQLGGEYVAEARDFITTLREFVNSDFKHLPDVLYKTERVVAAYHAVPAPVRASIDETLDISGYIDKILSDATLGEGYRRLGGELPVGATTSYRLRQMYFGLYLIGRSENQVPSEDIEELASEIAALHTQLAKEENQRNHTALSEWYSTVSSGTDTSSNAGDALVDLLSDCDEVLQLNLHAAYIAYALRTEISELDFSGLLEELRTRFPTARS